MMSTLANKHIILGVTGGIAAYKSPDIVRRLRERGAVVRVVMTQAAKEFITPLTLQAVSGNPIHDDLMDVGAEAAMGHIQLARWADLILIAPATANFLAELAHGHAHDLLSTLCLATEAKKVVAPAMNQRMWRDPVTQNNLKNLLKYDVSILEPVEGSQACGDVGPGRMLDPLDIVVRLEDFFETRILNGLKVLITAGPTIEPIDPVRFISNRSSGKMGFAMAEAAVEAGAEVTLIHGPAALKAPDRVRILPVETAQEMYNLTMIEAQQHDIFIAAAAVADYHVKNISPQKLKKTNVNIILELEPNPDILAEVANLQKRRPFVVGFAAETENLTANATKKLKDKHLDMVVANLVGGENGGFNQDQNAVTVIGLNEIKTLPLMSKLQLSRKLIIMIANYYNEKHSIENSG